MTAENLIWPMVFLFFCSWWLTEQYLFVVLYVDSQTDQFANLEQFKIISHFPAFELVKIDPTYSVLLNLGRSVIILNLGKMLGFKKEPHTSPLDKKFKNHAQDLAQNIFNDSISRNHYPVGFSS